MPPIEDPSASPDVSRPGRPASGLEFYIAHTMEEVEEAWGLVYDAYRRDNLIDVNPHRVHTTSQAVGPNTAVILGCLGPLAVGTISAYTDGPEGLPLDSVYLTEISALRRGGRKLMEVGLFADRRERINRAADGLFALMRFSYFFGFPMECDDIIIGVHPRHAPFYMRLLGFERIGPVRLIRPSRTTPSYCSGCASRKAFRWSRCPRDWPISRKWPSPAKPSTTASASMPPNLPTRALAASWPNARTCRRRWRSSKQIHTPLCEPLVRGDEAAALLQCLPVARPSRPCRGARKGPGYPLAPDAHAALHGRDARAIGDIKHSTGRPKDVSTLCLLDSPLAASRKKGSAATGFLPESVPSFAKPQAAEGQGMLPE